VEDRKGFESASKIEKVVFIYLLMFESVSMFRVCVHSFEIVV
jgi:hypothetical protein